MFSDSNERAERWRSRKHGKAHVDRHRAREALELLGFALVILTGVGFLLLLATLFGLVVYRVLA